GVGSLQRCFALAAIETGQVSAREHRPDGIVAIDVHSAWSESRSGCFRIVERHFVVFGHFRFRRIWSRTEADQSTGPAQCGSPDRTVNRTRRYTIDPDVDPFVFRWINRLIGLNPRVAFAVTVGIQNKRSPALSLRFVFGLRVNLRVEPAFDGAM